MQGTDLLASGSYPLGVIINKVLDSNHSREIEAVAQVFLQRAAHLNDHEIISFLNRDFIEATDETMKKKWAIFCIHVLLKKEYTTINDWQEHVTFYLNTLKTVPGIKKHVDLLENYQEIKRKELVANHLLSWLLEGNVKEAVITHEWFTDTATFINILEKACIQDPSRTEILEAFLYLDEVMPDLFSLNPARKIPQGRRIAKSVCRLSTSPLKEEFWHRLQERGIVESPTSPREEKKPVYLATLNKTMEDFFLVKSVDDAIDEALSLFAIDLASCSACLYKRIPLTDFSKQAWTKGKGESLVRFIGIFNELNAFVKLTFVGVKGSKRKSMIMFFINLAKRCFRLYDLNSACAIILAIESSEVSYHRFSWSPNEKELLSKEQTLLETFLPYRNYKNLRDLTDKYFKANQWFIPFLPPTLTDIISTDEYHSENFLCGEDALVDVRCKINIEKAETLARTLIKLFELKKYLNYKPYYSTDIVGKVHSKEVPKLDAP